MFTLLLACIIFNSVCAFGSAVSADIPLDGIWQVKGGGFSGEARLPGTLSSAKLGKRWTAKDFAHTLDPQQAHSLVQEWQYAGKAVWTRTLELSAADCAVPLEIFLERVMWRSEVFWDGEPLGSCDSLAAPHIYKIPARLLAPGRHEIRFCIDNSRFYNFSRQSHAYGPNMQAVWNGVIGKVSVRRSHPLRRARVFAAAPANGSLRVEVPEDFKVAPDSVYLEEMATLAVSPVDSPVARKGFKMVELKLGQEPVYWNEFHPELYTLVLVDRSGDFTHRIRFGFRTIGTDGYHLTLNGVKIFERGNVENANFAKDGIPWMEVEDWRKMLRTLKDEDGINAIRFHSWAPPAAAFAAADELGIIMHPEAGIWTDRWMFDADELGNGKPVDEFAKREMKAIADAFGNSPSYVSLSLGNELGNSNFETLDKWVAEHKKYDPRALCYASAARTVTASDDFSLSARVPGRVIAREKLFPHTDWDYEDLHRTVRVPTVFHEIGQWPVYPVWEELLSPFIGEMRPWNLSRHRDTAAKKNALRFQRQYHTASAKLNRLIYKEEVESFLRTPSCAGLQLLSVQDYTGQGEALVGWRDPFYDLKSGFKGMPPFSNVWGPVSFLARFPKFTYVAGETFRAKLQIRNLTEKPIEKGTGFFYTIAGKRTGFALPATIAPGSVETVAEVERVLDDSMTKRRQTLRFGGNEWNFWVYPKEESARLPSGVVETSDPKVMRAAIADGATVLYSGASFNSAEGRFKPVYWSAHWFPVRSVTSAALGTWFDVRHPALAGFVTDDFTDWQWYSLAQGATIHELKGLPEDYCPIALSVNDFHFSEFTSTMFEALVGKGRLFVCGYNLSAMTPEAKRLRASVVSYLASAPAAGTVRMPESWLDVQFAAAKGAISAGAVYDVATNLVGRTIRMDIGGVPPTTGSVRIDFYQPDTYLTTGRGVLDGKLFNVPVTYSKGAKTHVSIPVIREDFLDGKLELEVSVMTGSKLAIERVRVIPQKE
ncbi:MAG: hypothetical protein J6R18_06545 [Kiritimatiellae bacterium]|nr:hypothetical protein [Kiritimatiellia bacterium]